jgi:flagellar motor switch protein FliN
MADEMNATDGAEDEISWEDAFAEAAEGHDEEPVHEPSPMTAQAAEPAPSAVFSPTVSAGPGAVDIDFLLDIELNVTVEIGRKKIPIKDLLQLQQGAVIDLPKAVGEPYEVYINGKIMAFGEIVVVNEKFGIRLTDVIDPKERIEKLG